MTLVDDGTLDLDLPLARYVKEFDRDDRRRVTLRQCMSCVSGLPARINNTMRKWDMNRFASEAADEAMRAAPDTSFILSDQRQSRGDRKNNSQHQRENSF